MNLPKSRLANLRSQECNPLSLSSKVMCNNNKNKLTQTEAQMMKWKIPTSYLINIYKEIVHIINQMSQDFNNNQV